MEQSLNQIKQANLNNIALSVWEFNTEAMETQMDGIISIADVVEVKVLNQKGEVIESENKAHEKPLWLVYHKLPLETIAEGKKESVGHLEIWMTLDNMYFRLGVKVAYFFITQFLKTILVSTIMYLIFSHFIFRHIIILDNFFRNFKAGTLSLVKNYISLPFKEHEVNELTRLRDRVNEMIQILQKYDTELRQELNSAQNQNFNLNESQSRLHLIGKLGHETKSSLEHLGYFFETLSSFMEENSTDGSEKEGFILAQSELNLIKSNIERVNLILTGNKSGGEKSFKEILSSKLDSLASEISEIAIELTMDQNKSDICPYPWLNIVLANILRACSLNMNQNGQIFIDFKRINSTYQIVVWNHVPSKKILESEHSKIISELDLSSCESMIRIVNGSFSVDQSYHEGVKFKLILPCEVKDDIAKTIKIA